MKKATGIGVIAVIAGYLLFNIMQNRKFTVTNYTVFSPKLKNDFHAVLLADLHDKQYGENNRYLITEIEMQHPDAIFLAGDIVNYDDTEFSGLIQLLKDLSAIAPVYYGFGNHEYFLYVKNRFACLDEIRQMENVKVLEYSIEDTVIQGNNVRIGGMSISPDDYPKYGDNYFGTFEKPDTFFILMSHYPWTVPYDRPDTTVDVVLSGHAHGGQIHLWNDIGAYAPNYGFFSEYTSGIHIVNTNGTTEIVSRGLGDHTWIPRLNNPPELITIDFRKET